MKPESKPRRGPLQRLLAILAFLAGGVASELSHPFACTTVPSRCPSAVRRREERA
ncbi:hypothetical protein [Burkholderia gladioli]|uniref:hypothetical protein n=1 Tax=Burkholderia gladioli TaxID=28095 RepID=UPI000312743C|nr:hypothetical protein [Burkholderia gladioli]MBW5285668.1 hypothetical protein [Burkholderia gladioli]